jgi:ABC-type uncharacterized transport system substrate-binding protein
MMRRRDFITGAAGSAAVLPFAAHAQQGARVRRIAVMPPGTERDAEANARLSAFRQVLDQLGWRENRDVQFQYWWTDGNAERIRAAATEMVAAKPDLILSGVTPGVQALKRETTTIPIVFANVADPVGSGLVPNLAKPGGNVTGYTAVEYAIVGKWLGLLKEIAPEIRRVALLGSPDVVFTKSFFQELQGTAASFAVTPVAANVRTAAEVEQAIEAFAREPNGGLLFVPEFTATIHRALIFRLAASHKLPAVYPFRFFAVDGGLAAYGPDQVEQYRGAARYVDRIFRGAKPADLPVQAPTKFDLVINLKTARALGLTLPPTLVGRADEVIE